MMINLSSAAGSDRVKRVGVANLFLLHFVSVDLLFYD